MSSSYPIITEKVLGPAKRGGPRGWGRHRRAGDEIPQIKGEQVRVFLVDGKPLVDHGRRTDDDPQVVRAAHVAVVDMSRNVEVSVELSVPSEDAKEFTVRTTFLCSVTDPATVVRDGQGDAARALRGYVRSHQRLFQLGLDHPVSAINHVRLLVQTQIEAYVQLKPPVLPGIAAELASVEVLTPDEVRTLHGELSKQAALHTIESDRVNLEHELAQLKAEHAKQAEENDRRLEIERRKHETQMQEMRLVMKEQEEHLKRQMAAAANTFAAEQMDRMHDAIESDPERAALLAQQSGELSMGEVASRLDRVAEQKAEERRDERDRARRLEDEDRAWMRKRADQEYEVHMKAEQDERTRRYALEDARQALELKKLERIYAIEDGDRALKRELLERKYQSEERELERLNALKDKQLEMERERLQREYQAAQDELRHQYEVQAAERDREHAIEDRDHQLEVDRRIRDRKDRIELLRVRLDMLKELARHGHMDQVTLDPHELIEGIAVDTGAGASVTATVGEPEAALPEQAGDEDEGLVDDESALREEGLHDH
ncbi:hypothetical protein E1264_14120 [Actinomadura sp. KC216]|uniref:hypothetical protein n=1 Tax=Actinomadura sp. KC216 TaxID=2530370 RepID=UPI001043F29D|nr:hypothetical protein [Actinomadura sp. KC216]TDB87616.1 hypothetical protein E1264_14120 [Actinomadura sp. KC216]